MSQELDFIPIVREGHWREGFVTDTLVAISEVTFHLRVQTSRNYKENDGVFLRILQCFTLEEFGLRHL